MVDVWVSGSDSAGNPFNTLGNSITQPIASWSLALLGPSIDLDADSSSFSWDDPSPIMDQTVGLDFEVRNLGGRGDVAFVLQRAVNGGFWEDTARVDLVATAGAFVTGTLPTVANVKAGENINFRLLVLVDEVEMDRKSIDPLLIKEETIRDGEALALQAQEGTFSIVLYLIALISLSLAMWLLVMNRRIRSGEFEGGIEDQTAEVIDELNHSKMLPEITTGVPPPVGLTFPPPNPEVPFTGSVQPTVASLATSAPSGANLQSSPNIVQNTTYNNSDSAEGEIPNALNGSLGNDSPAQRAPPPIPPTGLPQGWTQDQWNHFGWQYVDAMTK